MCADGKIMPENWQPAKFEFQPGDPTARTLVIPVRGNTDAHARQVRLDVGRGGELLPAVNNVVGMIAGMGGAFPVTSFDHKAEMCTSVTPPPRASPSNGEARALRWAWARPSR
jgi:hypothetical protein